MIYCRAVSQQKLILLGSPLGGQAVQRLGARAQLEAAFHPVFLSQLHAELDQRQGSSEHVAILQGTEVYSGRRPASVARQRIVQRPRSKSSVRLELELIGRFLELIGCM